MNINIVDRYLDQVALIQGIHITTKFENSILISTSNLDRLWELAASFNLWKRIRVIDRRGNLAFSNSKYTPWIVIIENSLLNSEPQDMQDENAQS